jgi:hypothetical protein
MEPLSAASSLHFASTQFRVHLGNCIFCVSGNRRESRAFERVLKGGGGDSLSAASSRQFPFTQGMGGMGAQGMGGMGMGAGGGAGFGGMGGGMGAGGAPGGMSGGFGGFGGAPAQVRCAAH